MSLASVSCVEETACLATGLGARFHNEVVTGVRPGRRARLTSTAGRGLRTSPLATTLLAVLAITMPARPRKAARRPRSSWPTARKPTAVYSRPLADLGWCSGPCFRVAAWQLCPKAPAGSAKVPAETAIRRAGRRQGRRSRGNAARHAGSPPPARARYRAHSRDRSFPTLLRAPQPVRKRSSGRTGRVSRPASRLDTAAGTRPPDDPIYHQPLPGGGRQFSPADDGAPGRRASAIFRASAASRAAASASSRAYWAKSTASAALASARRSAVRAVQSRPAVTGTGGSRGGRSSG